MRVRSPSWDSCSSSSMTPRVCAARDHASDDKISPPPSTFASLAPPSAPESPQGAAKSGSPRQGQVREARRQGFTRARLVGRKQGPESLVMMPSQLAPPSIPPYLLHRGMYWPVLWPVHVIHISGMTVAGLHRTSRRAPRGPDRRLLVVDFFPFAGRTQTPWQAVAAWLSTGRYGGLYVVGAAIGTSAGGLGVAHVRARPGRERAPRARDRKQPRDREPTREPSGGRGRPTRSASEAPEPDAKIASAGSTADTIAAAQYAKSPPRRGSRRDEGERVDGLRQR